MIEIYFLFALIANIIADLMIWKEVKTMRIAHQTIMIDTQAMKITMDQSSIGFQEFSESLGPALTEHAKMSAKSLAGVIGMYQGKAEKATGKELEGLQETLGALGPLAQLIGSQSPPKNGSDSTKFHI